MPFNVSWSVALVRPFAAGARPRLTDAVSHGQ